MSSDSSSFASSNSYPPPPQRRAQTSSPASGSTLYSGSPHLTRDSLHRRRRERISCGLDPLHVVAIIVAVGFILSFQPQLWSLDTYYSGWPLRRSSSAPTLRPADLLALKAALQQDGQLCPCLEADREGEDSRNSHQHNNHRNKINNMVWQKTFTLPSNSKGCYLVTSSVEKEINEGLRGVKAGILTLFIQHTSAALSVNENFDSTVRSDMNMAMDRIVPESLPWKHTDEGPDDSASHTKASLFGASVTIPITDGRLNLGTWQGIYLCEFRAMKHSRRVVATVLS